MADFRQEGEWSGLPLYQCDSCPVSSVDAARMETHVTKDHARERVPEVEILGPNGAPVPSIPIPEGRPGDNLERNKPKDTAGDKDKADGETESDDVEAKAKTPRWRRNDPESTKE